MVRQTSWRKGHGKESVRVMRQIGCRKEHESVRVTRQIGWRKEQKKESVRVMRHIGRRKEHKEAVGGMRQTGGKNRRRSPGA